ncbi:Alpha/Beta hydrolase protein [Neohortaea acidophila]|uniref:Alpha/Beta hydrolase protein n=1 Tax=Neohortaea acidophila TaxID=245834 RepID=A0A6A6PUD3_9PEZI|nr:Alpha/Beta hydrolase protein [Neohortaea acidophila]KAF2483515.1 Alpha/Beta hydrolase protein [Neohortaea acidophila]
MALHTSGTVETGDGVSLAYDQWGDPSKPNIVLLSGWNQTAAQWRKQYSALSDHFHITTYDHRGHGESEKTDHGFRVSRLAADLDELLVQLNLRSVTLVGHSLGCAVIWCWCDLYPNRRSTINSLVFIDQVAVMLPRPHWTEVETKHYGCVFPNDEVPDAFFQALAGPDSRAVTSGFVASMFTSNASPDDVNFALEQNAIMDSKHAAALLHDHTRHDWRDVLPTINVPALVVGGAGSVQTPIAGCKWVAARIPGARFVEFSEEEGGSHCLFVENPTKFNAILKQFLETQAVSV